MIINHKLISVISLWQIDYEFKSNALKSEYLCLEDTIKKMRWHRGCSTLISIWLVIRDIEKKLKKKKKESLKIHFILCMTSQKVYSIQFLQIYQSQSVSIRIRVDPSKSKYIQVNPSRSALIWVDPSRSESIGV